MKINLSPQRRDDTLVLSVLGQTITVNGEVFDFSPMTDGDTLPVTAFTSMWFVDKVDKVGDELELTLLFPNPANYSPEQAFPVPMIVGDGPVHLPQPLPGIALTEEEPADE